MNPLSITDFFSSLTGGEIAGWGLAALIVLLSLIQISPVKLNPWDSIFAWMGKKLNGKALAELQKQVTTMWVNSHRGALLTFARECRAGVDHSPDEWSNALCIADEYEVYCEKNHVANGIVKADTLFIRNLYQELSREHKLYHDHCFSLPCYRGGAFLTTQVAMLPSERNIHYDQRRHHS